MVMALLAGTESVALCAIFCGRTRFIDNNPGGTGTPTIFFSTSEFEIAARLDSPRTPPSTNLPHQQAAKLEEELGQARDCLADMSSRMSMSMTVSRRGGEGERDTSSPNDPGTPSTPASSSNMLELSPGSVQFAAQVASSGGAGGGGGASTSGLARDGTAAARPAAVATADEWRAQHEHQQRQQRFGAGDRGGSSLSGDILRGGRGGGGGGGGRFVGVSSVGGTLMGQQAEGQHEGRPATSSSQGVTPAEAGSAVHYRGAGAPRLEEYEGGGGSGVGGREGALRFGEGGRGQAPEEEEGEGDSGVFDLEDVRGFVRRESQRLRESVRAGRADADNG